MHLYRLPGKKKPNNYKIVELQMTNILLFTKMKEAKSRVGIWAERIKMSISLTYSSPGVLQKETLPYSNTLWGNQACRVALYWRWSEVKSGVKRNGVKLWDLFWLWLKLIPIAYISFFVQSICLIRNSENQTGVEHAPFCCCFKERKAYFGS